MPSDPWESERAHDRLLQLATLHRTALARAAHPPRVDPEAWRGPAADAYGWCAELVAERMREAAAELGDAVALARLEATRALG
ncbi:hypothetical protein [Protaetiibacter mangrovi]|uniref:Uncharacterized protein n=1 Tax=Protaetiibacter mangrovi TaxID=2970926 RepID=A0ABT1ZHI6_9MICO|nr:hypothetical protein [Protaetiibacter mangrovi]MCS0500050.1 hypothetical protein [Protaetiibacter mangrovi]